MSTEKYSEFESEYEIHSSYGDPNDTEKIFDILKTEKKYIPIVKRIRNVPLKTFYSMLRCPNLYIKKEKLYDDPYSLQKIYKKIPGKKNYVKKIPTGVDIFDIVKKVYFAFRGREDCEPWLAVMRVELLDGRYFAYYEASCSITGFEWGEMSLYLSKSLKTLINFAMPPLTRRLILRSMYETFFK